MDNNWLMEESPGLNTDWFSEIRFFSSKKLNISLKINLSKISPQIGSNETGGSFLGFAYHLFYG